MNVQCGAFDWDGNTFNVLQYSLCIKKDYKQTAMAIDAQEVFPTRFYRDSSGERNDEALRRSLIKRGRRFVDTCRSEGDGAQYKYSGPILADVPAEGALAATQQSSRPNEDESRSVYSGLDDPLSLKKTPTTLTKLSTAVSFLRTRRGFSNRNGHLIICPWDICQECSLQIRSVTGKYTWS